VALCAVCQVVGGAVAGGAGDGARGVVAVAHAGVARHVGQFQAYRQDGCALEVTRLGESSRKNAGTATETNIKSTSTA